MNEDLKESIFILSKLEKFQYLTNWRGLKGKPNIKMIALELNASESYVRSYLSGKYEEHNERFIKFYEKHKIRIKKEAKEKREIKKQSWNLITKDKQMEMMIDFSKSMLNS